MNVRPQQWGKYELIERLGRGGMGEVWKARISGAAGFSRTLVVKRLLPHLLEDQRFVEMFLTEARLSARLEHPNIVQIFELGDVNGEFFLAMEYVHGRDLARVINQFVLQHQRPPVPMAAYVVREVCRALSYAHQLTDKHGARLGLIHRDVSPSNVMLALSGAVKLLDFGVAKAASESQNQATQTGVLKGKLWYMAPERVEAKSFDHRSDIFSTGVVLHETLTATRLFESQNPAKVINYICNKPIDPPSTINPEVPPELDRICLRALARDPDQRYASAAEMADELDELLFKLRWGAEQLARTLQSTFSLGTLVEPGALEPSLGDDSDARPTPLPAAQTLLARPRATPAKSPMSQATTAPAQRVVLGPSSRETTSPARQITGFIDSDKTAATESPPLLPHTNTTQKNTAIPEAYTGTEEAPLPPLFDDATRVTPSGTPPPGWIEGRLSKYQRLTAWRWPIAVAAGLLAVALVVVIGQASARRDGSVEMTVTSEPSGAQAILDGATRVVGKTPLSARLPRGDGYVLKVEHAGYEPYSMPVVADKDLRTHVVLRPLR